MESMSRAWTMGWSLSRCRTRRAPESRTSRTVMVCPRASEGSATSKRSTRNSETSRAVAASRLARSRSFAIREAW